MRSCHTPAKTPRLAEALLICSRHTPANTPRLAEALLMHSRHSPAKTPRLTEAILMRSRHTLVITPRLAEALLMRSCQSPANTPRLSEARRGPVRGSKFRSRLGPVNILQQLRGSPRLAEARLITEILVLARACCNFMLRGPRPDSGCYNTN